MLDKETIVSKSRKMKQNPFHLFYCREGEKIFKYAKSDIKIELKIEHWNEQEKM